MAKKPESNKFMSKDASQENTFSAGVRPTPKTIKTQVIGSEKNASGEVNREAAQEDAGRL